ncbi:MAG: hypothetical protein M1142_05920 [Patescibacteria group bacterium]|nr:hypothetical protein [Patescibacteria group bacterium]
MKKAYLPFTMLLLVLFSLPSFTKVFAAEEPVIFNVSPKGALNPGDSYTVSLTVYRDESRRELCNDCQVKLKFVDNDGTGQPGDEILQGNNKTDALGELEATVTSYTVIPDIGGRQIIAEITLPNGVKFSSSPLLLSYRNIPMLGFVRLITKLVSEGYRLPPMGNIYPAITKQNYLGSGIRQISLEINRPFGTKSYAIYVFPKDKWAQNSSDLNNWYQQHLAKITTNSKTKIDVSAFDDLKISVLACSQVGSVMSFTSVMPCVGPDDVILSKLEHTATQSGEIVMPLNADQQKSIQEEQNQFDQLFIGPIKAVLEGIYAKF